MNIDKLQFRQLDKDGLQTLIRWAVEEGWECARMYYGEVPDIELDKVFGITTFELG